MFNFTNRFAQQERESNASGSLLFYTFFTILVTEFLVAHVSDPGNIACPSSDAGGTNR